MAGSSRLRWGLLGTARINQAVIGPIRASKFSELKAVASRSLTKAAEYARTWGIPQSYGSYEELLADPAIDVIYISLPNSLHAAWSIRAMQLGKHVLCEKPLTTSVSDAEQVIAAANKNGRVIAEAFMYRHHPQSTKIKQMIEQRQIGNLQLVRGSFCYTNTRPENIRLDPTLGGGSLWDVGCYPISYARYLCGEEPSIVFGQQVTGPTGIDLLFAGQLKFPNGVIAQFECSFITPNKSIMEITGDKGRISIPTPYNPGKKTEILLEINGRTSSSEIKGAELYEGEIQDIEEAISDGKPTLISLEDSRGNIAAIEALYRSARLEIPVDLQNSQEQTLGG